MNSEQESWTNYEEVKVDYYMQERMREQEEAKARVLIKREKRRREQLALDELTELALF